MPYNARPLPTNFRLNVTATMPDTGEQRRFPQPDTAHIEIENGEPLLVDVTFVGIFPAGTLGVPAENWGDMNHLRYIATLRYQDRVMVTDYMTGSGIPIYDKKIHRSVVESLTLDGTVETFEEWCSDFGYDTDSREHHRTWLACAEVDRNLRTLLGRTGRARLTEIVEGWNL